MRDKFYELIVLLLFGSYILYDGYETVIGWIFAILFLIVFPCYILWGDK
jgi:hypothetical protein